MPIRIKCCHKPRDRAQPTEDGGQRLQVIQKKGRPALLALDGQRGEIKPTPKRRVVDGDDDMLIAELDGGDGIRVDVRFVVEVRSDRREATAGLLASQSASRRHQQISGEISTAVNSLTWIEPSTST